ncbi:MAG: hypothetical protein ACOYIK_00890 [Coriobacteriales bacterium]
MKSTIPTTMVAMPFKYIFTTDDQLPFPDIFELGLEPLFLSTMLFAKKAVWGPVATGSLQTAHVA